MTHMILCKMDVLFGWFCKRFLQSIVFPAKSNDSRWHSYDISTYKRNLPTLALWRRNEYLTSGSTEIMAWKWFSNVERSWCLQPFTGNIFLVTNSFIPPHFQPFARSSFLRVCLQSILIEAQITYNTPLHIFTFFNFLASLCCLSLSTKLFSCPFFSTSMAIHFTSSSPGTPGQTFNRLKKIEWYRLGHLADIELRKLQKVLNLIVRVFFSFSCLCAKNVGQVRFFGVCANITLASK